MDRTGVPWGDSLPYESEKTAALARQFCGNSNADLLDTDHTEWADLFRWIKPSVFLPRTPNGIIIPVDRRDPLTIFAVSDNPERFSRPRPRISLSGSSRASGRAHERPHNRSPPEAPSPAAM